MICGVVCLCGVVLPQAVKPKRTCGRKELVTARNLAKAPVKRNEATKLLKKWKGLLKVPVFTTLFVGGLWNA
jgi:hypothetical protein